jgi:hypothetical protein
VRSSSPEHISLDRKCEVIDDQDFVSLELSGREVRCLPLSASENGFILIVYTTLFPISSKKKFKQSECICFDNFMHVLYEN